MPARPHNYTLLDYALFVAYFPHLIAGPIVRHNDLIPQFRQTARAPMTISPPASRFSPSGWPRNP